MGRRGVVCMGRRGTRLMYKCWFCSGNVCSVVKSCASVMGTWSS